MSDTPAMKAMREMLAPNAYAPSDPLGEPRKNQLEGTIETGVTMRLEASQDGNYIIIRDCSHPHVVAADRTDPFTTVALKWLGEAADRRDVGIAMYYAGGIYNEYPGLVFTTAQRQRLESCLSNEFVSDEAFGDDHVVRERASIRALDRDAAQLAHAESYQRTGGELLEELVDYMAYKAARPLERFQEHAF